MDDKQKKMLAVLCVLVVAMGGTWFFLWRDTGPALPPPSNTPAQKTVLDRGSSKTEEKEKKLDRRRDVSQEAPRERHELDRSREDNRERRGLDRSRGPQEKKKKTAPMA